MTRNRIKNVCPFLILFFLMFFIHMRMSLNLSDDAGFSQILHEKTLFEHMKNLYMNVNGKIFPDTMSAVFTSLPKVFFCLVSSAMYVIIAYSISVLFLGNNLQANLISAAGVLYFPFSILTSAGYVATSANYVWTSAMFLFALLPIRRCLNKQPISVFLACLYTLSALYAGNQEQTSVLLCMIYSCFIALIIWQKRTKESAFIIYMGILNIISLLTIFLAPGHANRSTDYSIFRIPNWTSLDIVDKLYLGFTTTISHYINQTNIVFLLFSILLLVFVFTKNRNFWYRSIGTIPIFLYILFSSNLMQGKVYDITHFSFPWSWGNVSFCSIDIENYRDISSYIPILICLLIIFSLLLALYFISSNYMEFVLYCIILLCGMATRMVMAFSPTLFGSSTRTFTYLYIAFIILNALLLLNIKKWTHAKMFLLLQIVFLAGAINNYCVSFYHIL